MSFTAVCLNQYKAAIGEGSGATREEAITNAKKKSKEILGRANPHWKWRVANIKVQEWPDGQNPHERTS